MDNKKLKNVNNDSDKFMSEELLFHFPIKYQDETRILNIEDLKIGITSQIEVIIQSINISYKPYRQLSVIAYDNTGFIKLRWLNFYPSLLKNIKINSKVRVLGIIRSQLKDLEIIHPIIKDISSNLPETFTPIYYNIPGIKQKDLKRNIEILLNKINIFETLPDDVIKSNNLIPIESAINIIHRPSPRENINNLIDKSHKAWIRLKFDELIARNLFLLKKKSLRLKNQAIPLLENKNLKSLFIDNLDFNLTNSQIKVIKEISHDLTQHYPMNRVLQGDVGSGKTVVAAMSIIQAVANNTQAVLMTPTEILAEQHFNKFVSWFQPVGISVALLTASQKMTKKQEIINQILSGEINLVIGTQAIIQDKIIFKKLGLSIIDEQHKFGVWQRSSLKNKNLKTGSENFIPHQLAMSATPIPRTLAMTILSDIDISTIDEIPAGREMVVTKLISNNRRNELINKISKELEQGKQAYWVCPIIDESEKVALQNAMYTYKEITSIFPPLSIEVIHGKLSQKEKSNIMDNFINGNIRLLIATTIIEVGVDVPNASIMVIENAERFGLAQLHQLRGRIGRGKNKSTCVLLYQEPLSNIAMDRLKVMFETNDGFEIAKKDLDQRGPGEFLGTKQSGAVLFKFVNIYKDQELLEKTKNIASYIHYNYQDLAKKHLERWKFLFKIK